jgi:hypothetical protein
MGSAGRRTEYQVGLENSRLRWKDSFLLKLRTRCLLHFSSLTYVYDKESFIGLWRFVYVSVSIMGRFMFERWRCTFAGLGAVSCGYLDDIIIMGGLMMLACLPTSVTLVLRILNEWFIQVY